MTTTTITMTSSQKEQIRKWIKSYEDETIDHAQDVGINVGLKWVTKTLGIQEYLHDAKTEEATFTVAEDVIETCKKEYKENWITAEWNFGYARGIYSVLYVLGIEKKEG